MGAYATDRSLFARLAPTNRTIEPLNVHPDSPRDLCGVISQMISSYWLSGCSCGIWRNGKFSPPRRETIAEWRRNLSETRSAVENECRRKTFTIDHLECGGKKKRGNKSSLKVAKKLLKVVEKRLLCNIVRRVAQKSLPRVIFHAYSRLVKTGSFIGLLWFCFRGALVGSFCASASADSHFQFLLCTLRLQIAARKSPARLFFN